MAPPEVARETDRQVLMPTLRQGVLNRQQPQDARQVPFRSHLRVQDVRCQVPQQRQFEESREISQEFVLLLFLMVVTLVLNS